MADVEQQKAAGPAKAPARRGPGRPPKKAAPAPLERKGIVERPQNPDNTAELVAGNPTFFKALFTYLKRQGVTEIQWRFTPANLVLRAWNHEKTVRIIILIPGEQMVHYYCEAEDSITIAYNNVEKVFSCIKSSYEKITFVRRASDPDHLRILLKNSRIGKTCDHTIVRNPFNADEALDEAEVIAAGLGPDEYALVFTLPFEDVKTTYEAAKVYTSVASIEKFGDHPLRIAYAKGGVAVQEVYQEPEKIGLASRVGPDQWFKIEVPLTNIAAVALAKVTDSVEIFCDAGKRDLAFRSRVEGISVVTLAPHLSPAPAGGQN